MWRMDYYTAAWAEAVRVLPVAETVTDVMGRVAPAENMLEVSLLNSHY